MMYTVLLKKKFQRQNSPLPWNNKNFLDRFNDETKTLNPARKSILDQPEIRNVDLMKMMNNILKNFIVLTKFTKMHLFYD